ncbi:NAD kinase [Formosa sp. Hel3_A1_48]|jgi:NAD+ kinase|uniref:NAD kinase n=1 Tax=Formosa sp. Hel3_A1_48 TaxID=1336795 RepID=UPI00084E33E9|nr:NAD kinase [Formosa sp. Hel3_A1_48]AOR26177.1 NAD kinase [Formosa sp. Hel3_A1_48]MDC0951093.1 NAD kinase [Flavobacteriaceae bacterium]
MKIAVYGPEFNERSHSAIAALFAYLGSKSAEVFVDAHFFNSILEHSSINIKANTLGTFTDLDDSFDLMISVGGDGTILRAITHVKDLDIPIVGINTGRLGFLATIKRDDIIGALDQIFEGKYRISKRSVLSVTTNQKESNFELDFALNEVTVSRKNTTSMISIETWLDDEYLNSYWADGLIISTPTGSTGYSMSCGGPVIMPESDSLVITPIAPHNLNARPLVISAKHKIRLNVSGREHEYLVSLDSRINSLDNSIGITIKKAAFDIKMIELKAGTFIQTLRKKLLWGADPRN